ncbi:hypothetical protein BH20VER2_BH20VER2_13900 [soil metagenome]
MPISASQLAYPLLVALALKSLFLRRGFPYAEHLIFALHLLAFIMLSLVATWPVYVVNGIGVQVTLDVSAPRYFLVTAATMLWTIAYLVLALRRAYSVSWPGAIARGAVVYLTYLIASMIFMYGLLAVAIRFSGR